MVMINVAMKSCFILSLLVLLFAQVGYAEDVKIGDGGMQSVVVALSPGATEAEQWAAQELVTAIANMTDVSATVELTNDYHSLPLDSFAFLLGVLDQSALLQPLINSGDLLVSPSEPKYDGFILKYLNKDNLNMMIISGRKSRSVLNGVFHLLERQWHCGFFDDSLESPRYPSVNVLEIPVQEQIIAPIFEHREVIDLCNYAFNHGWNQTKKNRTWTICPGCVITVLPRAGSFILLLLPRN